jgi:hypothetical protein
MDTESKNTTPSVAADEITQADFNVEGGGSELTTL